MKIVGSKLEPWGAPALTVKTSYPEPPEAFYYWKKKKQGQILELKFHKT